MEYLIISKELLSEVMEFKKQNKLPSDLDFIRQNNNEIEFGFILKNNENMQNVFHVNIHELAHKCKEWLSDKGFIICTEMHYSNTGAGMGTSLCKLRKRQSGSSWIGTHFVERYEPESIFKACQWILENKGKQ